MTVTATGAVSNEAVIQVKGTAIEVDTPATVIAGRVARDRAVGHRGRGTISRINSPARGGGRVAGNCAVGDCQRTSSGNATAVIASRIADKSAASDGGWSTSVAAIFTPPLPLSAVLPSNMLLDIANVVTLPWA